MLRTLIVAYSWTIILSFTSRIIALFSQEAGGTDKCFVDIMECKNIKHYIKKKILAIQYTVEYQLSILVIARLRSMA